MYRSGMKTIIVIVWVLSILTVIARMLPWTDEDDTKRSLNYSGFTDVRTKGHSFFTCMTDWSATEFEATNPIGMKRVSGTVCCGLVFKACTIRW